MASEKKSRKEWEEELIQQMFEGVNWNDVWMADARKTLRPFLNSYFEDEG